MLDANHGFDAIEAIALGRRVASLDIGWFEEPVVPDDLNSYVEVRRGQPIPVAGGEWQFTRWGFREVLTLAPSTYCSPTRVRPAAFRSARRLPTWRRRSACATCRTYGAAASALRPPYSSLPYCPLSPAASAARADAGVRPLGASVPAGRADAAARARGWRSKHSGRHTGCKAIRCRASRARLHSCCRPETASWPSNRSI